MPDEAEIWRRVQDVFVRFFDNSGLTINAATTAGDIPGWDSLANVELMVEIEEAFGIRFRTGEVAGLETVGELVSLITRRAGT